MTSMSFDTQYDQTSPRFSILGPKVESLIVDLVAARSFDVHHISHRLKSRDSTVRKLERKAGPTAEGGLTDLLGVRVITYFADHVDEIASIVETEFEVDLENSIDKRALLDPDRFGYLSAHYVVSISGARLALPEWEQFSGLQFEIQIRSILQHSWAEIEHDLGYKAASSVPSDVRRRFSRLAGLLELADAEFRSIRDDLIAYEQGAVAAVAAGHDVEINRDSIAALVEENPTIVLLEQRIVQRTGGILTPIENYYASDRSTELQSTGYQNTSDVVRAVSAEMDWIVEFAVARLMRAGVSSPGFNLEVGRWEELPKGIGLLYFYRHLLLLSGDADDIVEEFGISGEGADTLASLQALHAASRRP